jgi:hypothetical protein
MVGTPEAIHMDEKSALRYSGGSARYGSMPM